MVDQDNRSYRGEVSLLFFSFVSQHLDVDKRGMKLSWWDDLKTFLFWSNPKSKTGACSLAKCFVTHHILCRVLLMHSTNFVTWNHSDFLFSCTEMIFLTESQWMWPDSNAGGACCSHPTKHVITVNSIDISDWCWQNCLDIPQSHSSCNWDLVFPHLYAGLAWVSWSQFWHISFGFRENNHSAFVIWP